MTYRPQITGKQIREMRIALGLTAAECAAKMGYKSHKNRNLKDRWLDFENGKQELPVTHRKLLIIAVWLKLGSEELDECIKEELEDWT